jgi:hypothetical protein
MAYTGTITLIPFSSLAEVSGMVYGCVTIRAMFDAGGCFRRVSGVKSTYVKLATQQA